MQTPVSVSTNNDLKSLPLPVAMWWSAIGNVFSLAGRLLVGVLIARALSLSDFGTFSYLIWLVGFTCTVGNFGIVYSTSRQAAIFQAKNSVPKAASITNLGLKLLGIAFLLVCFSILIATRPYWSADKVILLFVLVIAAGEMFGPWAIGWFSTYLNYKSISIIGIVSIAVLLIVVLFVRKKATLGLFLLAYAVSHCVKLIVVLRLFPTIGKLAKGVIFSKDRIKKVALLGLEYWVTIVGACILWQRFEIAYLKIFSSEVEIAKFAATSQISAIIVYAVTFFATPVSPYMARMVSTKGYSYLGDKWRILNKYMALLSMIPVVFIVSNSEVILGLLYGIKYAGLGKLLSLLALSAFIYGITSILAGVIFGLGKPRINLLSVLLTIPVTVSLAFIIVPKMGAMGAAFTRFVGYLLSLAILSVFVRKKLGPPFRKANLIKIVTVFFTSLIFASLPSLLIEQPLIRLICSGLFELVAVLFMLRIVRFIEVGEMVLVESALGELPGVFRWPLYKIYSLSISK